MFGAFCPLPLRLTVDELRGLSAAQFKRLAADMLGMRRLRPVGRLVLTQAGTPTITNYTGINGSGAAYAPTAATVGTGQTTVTFPAYYTDRKERARPISLMAAKWSVNGSTPMITTIACTGNNVAEVTTVNLGLSFTDATIAIVFYGCWEEEPTLDDYGAADDKEDVADETVPYSWTWYQEHEGMLGSAFTTGRTGYVHAQKLALARLFGAGLQRASERAACNFNPATSDDMLDTWARVFSLEHGPSTPKWETRQDCAARMRLLGGITQEAINSAAATVLGDLFVDVHRHLDNDLTDPPDPTYWPGGDPGDPTWGLCGYQWSSARAHLWVEVKLPTSVLDADFHHLVDVRLFRLLDLALPAHATFGWATSSGFVLGTSLLGYDAL